jgi:hypothetical protein
LVNGIAAGTTRGGGGSVALTQAIDLRRSLLLKIRERLTRGQNIRMLVGKSQQQIVEFRLRLVYATKGIEATAAGAGSGLAGRDGGHCDITVKLSG